MNTKRLEIPEGRTRRTYSAEFKAKLVAQCCKVGVSSAAIAISHGMNPNVLRRWVKESGQAVAVSPELPERPDPIGFVAIPMAAERLSGNTLEPSQVRIELERHGTTIVVSWPVAHLSASATWVREVLR